MKTTKIVRYNNIIRCIFIDIWAAIGPLQKKSIAKNSISNHNCPHIIASIAVNVTQSKRVSIDYRPTYKYPCVMVNIKGHPSALIRSFSNEKERVIYETSLTYCGYTKITLMLYTLVYLWELISGENFSSTIIRYFFLYYKVMCVYYSSRRYCML